MITDGGPQYISIPLAMMSGAGGAGLSLGKSESSASSSSSTPVSFKDEHQAGAAGRHPTKSTRTHKSNAANGKMMHSPASSSGGALELRIKKEASD